MKSDNISDERDLVNRMKAGDAAAFRSLYNLYKNKLIFFGYKITKSKPVAEEIVQDVFVKIWLSRTEINPELSIKAYLYKITKNLVLNHLKKIASEEKAIQGLWNTISEEQSYTEDIIKTNEFEQIAKQAVSMLPPQKRLIFELSRQNNLTHKEIADKLNISPNTVRNHMVEALKFIRSYIVINGELSLLIIFFIK